jgi:hypothetical protein
LPEEEPVSAAVHGVQAGVGDAVGEDAAVEQWDDRVVVAGQHEGRLPELV